MFIEEGGVKRPLRKEQKSVELFLELMYRQTKAYHRDGVTEVLDCFAGTGLYRLKFNKFWFHTTFPL